MLVRMGRAVVSKPVLADVAVFFVVYMVSLGVGVLVVATIEAVPAQTAFGAMLTCLSNMGPAAFHDAAGFSDNFAAYTWLNAGWFTGHLVTTPAPSSATSYTAAMSCPSTLISGSP